MFRRVVCRLSAVHPPSATGAAAAASATAGTATYVPTQVVFLEVWEHFKRFGMSECGDAVTVRLQAPPEAVTLLNNTVYMRNHLELFLAPPPGPIGQHVEKGWQVGSFRNSRNASRRLIVEALLSHGWSLEQQNSCVSERDMIVTSFTFVKRP